MKMNSMKKWLSFFLCIVLIAAMALTGCSDNNEVEIPSTDTTSEATTGESFADGAVLGEGATSFTFTVVDTEGKERAATIRTDKTIVGDALVELGLIAGEQSDYGLYVKTVNGTTLDYDTDGKYWAFYVDGEYAMTGVDTTEITAGATYTFKAE